MSERHYGPLHWDKRDFRQIYCLCLNVAPYSKHFTVRYFSQILFLTMPIKISMIFGQRSFPNLERVEKFVVIRIQNFEGNYERKTYDKE